MRPDGLLGLFLCHPERSEGTRIWDRAPSYSLAGCREREPAVMREVDGAAPQYGTAAGGEKITTIPLRDHAQLCGCHDAQRS